MEELHACNDILHMQQISWQNYQMEHISLCFTVFFCFQLLPSPRMFKTHSPYFLMPGGEPTTSSAKYIYLARNPKDTAVSYFHYSMSYMLYEHKGDWDDFFESFVSGKVAYGSWFEHVLPWWQHRGRNKVICPHSL